MRNAPETGGRGACLADTISNFAVEETLAEAGRRPAVVLLCKLDGRDCVLELKQRAALADPRALEDALPKLKLTLTNHSGAERPLRGDRSDDGRDLRPGGGLARARAPSSASGPPRSASSRDAEAYDRSAFAEAQAAKIGWTAPSVPVRKSSASGATWRSTRRFSANEL